VGVAGFSALAIDSVSLELLAPFSEALLASALPLLDAPASTSFLEPPA